MDPKASVIAFLRDNPESTETAVSKATKLKGKALRTAIDDLKEIEVVIENEEKLLSLKGGQEVSDNPEGNEAFIEEDASTGAPDAPGATETDQEPEPTTDSEVVTQLANENGPATSRPKGRDNGKYLFGGETLGKGPLVRAVVRDYVDKNPEITHDGLKEVFPDELLHRFGIFQELERAKKYYGNRDRFFLKEEHCIKLADCTVAVCSQFTATNIVPFVNKAKELGYVIESV